ncbi:amino acid ABC transporter substrate-binding protein [Chitinasiproducens palmae]|uniref:Amino acid ABC transporter substrate-binding protein, PAAT family n=1 Tax=Chitinasiproducens palmae TaxID=1770053 RepID=A0A1H2PME0_9BURK|nr:amino acid ABC transporter substrate-binding protein [Chitinasiproducens palmae]SDV47699.1 amino acid ABC transporter substrate-binding protein, PAAT family [Chitinasiproducens palmae]
MDQPSLPSSRGSAESTSKRTAVRTKVRPAAALACALALCSASAVARPVLDTVRRSGILTVSYAVDNAPLSYVDAQGQPIGYAFELSQRIGAAVSKALGGRRVTIKPIRVDPADRLRLVEDGAIQLECSATTITPERARRVSFSPAFYVGGARLLVLRGSAIHGVDDLGGKRVIVTTGSTSAELLRRLNQQKHLNIGVLLADNHERAIEMLRTHRADAFALDDILLAGLMSNLISSRKRDDFEIVGAPLSEEAYGCMIRKSDPGFRKVVDDEIERLRRTGELRKLYHRWFETPIPPRNVSFDLKANPQTERAIAPEGAGWPADRSIRND